jgi:ribA/ribD-fused uncharacterized protein
MAIVFEDAWVADNNISEYDLIEMDREDLEQEISIASEEAIIRQEAYDFMSILVDFEIDNSEESELDDELYNELEMKVGVTSVNPFISIPEFNKTQNMNEKLDFVHVILGNKTPMSMFHINKFKVDNVTFTSLAQYMSYMKAIMFDDFDSANNILNAKTPLEAKRISWSVKNFDQDTWEETRADILYRGCRARFTQDLEARICLLETRNKRIVLTNIATYTCDKIWGVGLFWSPENQIDIRKGNYDGLNLLGKALERVRSELSD